MSQPLLPARTRSLPSLALLTALLAGALNAEIRPLQQAGEATAVFPLVHAGRAAPLVVPAHAPEVVRIAARELASDIAAITGVEPQVLTAGTHTEGPRVELVLDPELSGRWEAFRLSATPGTLVIAGSDKRGLAYGIYELSRRLGVSPWQWWADVPIPRRPELLLSLDTEPVDQPAVKYRGIFINDEDWGLEPWASQTFEPEAGNIGPKTYSRIFSLMLRLRANLLWPGMHPTTTPFHRMPGNAAAADAHAIIVGSSHAEPMLLNNGREWPHEREQFNYLTHSDTVKAYWEQRVLGRLSGESLFTIGMRGINDSPIIGPKTQQERIATLERVFGDQRAMLARHLGGGDPTRVPQLFCPYKEVLEDYDAGLRVPDDVTLVWPDDNFGYVRHFTTPAEQARGGGSGVYYHASYSGLPQSWLWIDVMPPALIWSEMMRAYGHGARTLWIVNVGDLKNTERSTEFFLDLAWHADRTDPGAPARHVRAAAARDFGESRADAIASLLGRLQLYSTARRAEHLQWHLSLTPYLPTELNEAEIAGRLVEAGRLLRDSETLAASLPAEARDAYFELVHYPVAITAAANRRYFSSELARADEARGRDAAPRLAAAEETQAELTALTAHYNGKVAGGKWRNIVSENGYSPKAWPRFQRDTTTPRPAPSPANVAPAAPRAPSPLSRPEGARPGDFVERDGVVAMHAAHFTARQDLPGGAGWRVLPGLGRTGAAVTVLPFATPLPAPAPATTPPASPAGAGQAAREAGSVAPSATASLDYRFHVADGGTASLRVRLLPTHPLVAGQGLRLAVSIDGGAPLPVELTEGFDTRRSDAGMTAWQRRVLSNAAEATLRLPGTLSPGWHTLRILAVDTGVVVDRILLCFREPPPSYDGPDETRLP